MKPIIKKIIIFLIVAIVIIAGYIAFSGKSSTSSQTGPLSSSTGATDTSGAGSASASSAVDPAFLSTLLTLKAINLDTAIFSDDAFNSLQDLSVPLGQADPEGRPNPFAPIGSDSGSALANVTILTAPASAIAKTTATLNASISDMTNATSFWFEWGRTQTTLTATQATAQASTTGTWSGTLTGLLPSTLYYVRAGATVSGSTIYGPTITFTTK